uniref:Uncharacterized protein n=1 Tax=Physcomitrium patens TaxID=3218 RepID=A0A2K1K7A5_PHYPA|nr:hypothetical protein PHYPA_011552 [Physcomitrium patens]
MLILETKAWAIGDQGRLFFFALTPPCELPLDFITPTVISETLTQHTDTSTHNDNGNARIQEAPGVRKRRKMKELFARVTPRPDILFLQEHKYSLEECQIRAQKVDFLRYTSRWSDTRYSAARDSFTGGIGMLLSKKLAEQICEHGVIDSGRAQYVTLQLSHNLKLGIINVYGYNDTGTHYIMAGDFNCIEQISDKQGGAATTGRGQNEITAWNDLTLFLELSDCFLNGHFRKVGNKLFTWDNGRQAPQMVCSCIDRIYLPTAIHHLGGLTGIWSSMPHISDHAPIFVKLNADRPPPPKPIRFNTHLLKIPESRTLLLQTWQQTIRKYSTQNRNNRVAAAIQAVKVVSDWETKTKRRKKDWSTEFENQFSAVYEAEITLQNQWNDAEARNKLDVAQSNLQRLRQGKMEKKYDHKLANWIRVGNRCSKEFFELHSGQRRSTILKAQNANGRILTDPIAICAYVDNYYTSLVPRKISETQNTRITRPLTLSEVRHAKQAIPADRATGPDGIPAEFYHEFLTEISTDLFELFIEIFNSHELNRELNTSKIVLLPKPGDLTLVTNLRPISLLDYVYKVYAKLLATRIQELLPLWIRTTQTAFVPGRSIFDNIYTAYEAMHWAEQSQ